MHKLELDSLNLAFELFDDIYHKNELNDEILSRYYHSGGIKFLCKHMKYWSNVDLTFRDFKALFIHGISKSHSNNILVSSIIAGCRDYRKWMELSKSINWTSTIKKANELASEFLPTETSFDVTVYPLCGIRGTAIVLEKEIGIDLVDSSLTVDGEFQIDRLVKLVAHEIHHIQLDIYTKKILENESDENGRYIKMVAELLSEGTAMFYLTNPYEISTLQTDTWRKNMSNIDEHIENVINYLKDNDESQMRSLYDESIIGYSVGYSMVEKIHKTYGKSKVMDCVSDPRLFIEMYIKANNAFC